MHYYQFNIGDYAKHTRHLTNNEDLAYRRMLDLCYLNEKPIENNFKKVARLIDMRGCEEEVENVLNDFFELKDDHWHNNRVEKDLAFYAEKAERARENGKKGGRPPKKQPKKQAAKQPENVDNTPALAFIPLTGNKQYELKQSQVEKWAELYPAVNLSQEVSKMIGWLDANPTKRKTSRGILKFMNNWLSRAQDNGQQYAPAQQAQPAQNEIQWAEELPELMERSQRAQQAISDGGIK